MRSQGPQSDAERGTVEGQLWVTLKRWDQYRKNVLPLGGWRTEGRAEKRQRHAHRAGARVEEVGDGEFGPSRVVAQEPEAGRKGHEGQLVRLTVSAPYPASVLAQNPECLDRTRFRPGGKPNEPT